MTDTYLASLAESMTSTLAYDGQPATIFHLANNRGMTASFMDIGATWLSCTIPMDESFREVILRSANMDEHRQQSAYFGASVGRYANRIAPGGFTIDGHHYTPLSNEGEKCLHGGPDGFDKRRWLAEQPNSQCIVFSLISPDGDQGFPGQASISVRYQLSDAGEISIDYVAQCDHTCPISLTNHAYFNLAGVGNHISCLDHSLQMSAPYYLPTTPDMLPLGPLKKVSETGFDFRLEKPLSTDFLLDSDQKMAGGYDHSFVLDEMSADGQTELITLKAPDNSLSMTVATTMPSVQVYTGNFLSGHHGAHGVCQNHDGIALETQFYPDGPNHPEWGSASGILEAGKTYQHVTRYRFHYRAPEDE